MEFFPTLCPLTQVPKRRPIIKTHRDPSECKPKPNFFPSIVDSPHFFFISWSKNIDNKLKLDNEGEKLTIGAEVRQEDPVLTPGDLALGLRDGVVPLLIAQLGGLDDEITDHSANLELISPQWNSRRGK